MPSTNKLSEQQIAQLVGILDNLGSVNQLQDILNKIRKEGSAYIVVDNHGKSTNVKISKALESAGNAIKSNKKALLAAQLLISGNNEIKGLMPIHGVTATQRALSIEFMKELIIQIKRRILQVGESQLAAQVNAAAQVQQQQMERESNNSSVMTDILKVSGQTTKFLATKVLFPSAKFLAKDVSFPLSKLLATKVIAPSAKLLATKVAFPGLKKLARLEWWLIRKGINLFDKGTRKGIKEAPKTYRTAKSGARVAVKASREAASKACKILRFTPQFATSLLTDTSVNPYMVSTPSAELSFDSFDNVVVDAKQISEEAQFNSGKLGGTTLSAAEVIKNRCRGC